MISLSCPCRFIFQGCLFVLEKSRLQLRIELEPFEGNDRIFELLTKTIMAKSSITSSYRYKIYFESFKTSLLKTSNIRI